MVMSANSFRSRKNSTAPSIGGPIWVLLNGASLLANTPSRSTQIFARPLRLNFRFGAAAPGVSVLRRDGTTPRTRQGRFVQVYFWRRRSRLIAQYTVYCCMAGEPRIVEPIIAAPTRLA